MWNPASSQSPDGTSSQKADKSKRTTLQILPCTVSQLLTAPQVGADRFTIWDLELHQVSVVGVVRGSAPFVTNIQYSVDDMTGPPLPVKQWVNTEDGAPMASTGTYVRVTGSLWSFDGQRSLLAMDVRCIVDLNEITSHMLEVVRAHMQFSGKVFDVNMNTTAASLSESSGGHKKKDISPNDLSAIQGQVLQVIRKFSGGENGIDFQDLQRQLDYLSTGDIRTSLTFLTNEGHVFCTIDEHHFRSAEH